MAMGSAVEVTPEELSSHVHAVAEYHSLKDQLAIKFTYGARRNPVLQNAFWKLKSNNNFQSLEYYSFQSTRKHQVVSPESLMCMLPRSALIYMPGIQNSAFFH